MAREAPPRIWVGSTSREVLRAFYVHDSGVGFDVAEADKLLQAFQRLGTALGFEGIGVGLATVKRVVGRRGGPVWAEGGVGRGATFSFTI